MPAAFPANDDEGEILPPPASHHGPWKANSSHYEEWFTPAAIIEAARTCMGGIDLDPASCAKANETVRATRYLTADDDALNVELRWHGRIFCNPPYVTGKIERFVGKLVSEYEHPDGGVTEAVLLTNNTTETRWWQLAISRRRARAFRRAE